MNFYISDLHFGHENVIKFDNRPFKNINEMNEALIRNWNKVVTENDRVFILGDFSLPGKTEKNIEILGRLNGHKVLIKGNHDKVKDEKYTNCFDDIASYKEISESGNMLVLSHFPIACFNKRSRGAYHFYGHVHNSLEALMMERFKKEFNKTDAGPCNMYNVGCMLPWMNYTPRTFKEIVNGYEKYKNREDIYRTN